LELEDKMLGEISQAQEDKYHWFIETKRKPPGHTTLTTRDWDGGVKGVNKGKLYVLSACDTHVLNYHSELS
jgi:hypothetical protein